MEASDEKKDSSNIAPHLKRDAMRFLESRGLEIPRRLIADARVAAYFR